MKANDKDLAEFARLGLRFQVLAPAAVIAWADSIIERSVIPDPWLIELALAAKPDAIEDALRHVPGESQSDLAIRLFLALILRRWRSGCLSIGAVRGIGWMLHCESALPDRNGQADWGVCLEVEGEELDEGWRTENDLCKSIDEILAEYSDLETKLPAWT